MGDAFSTRTGVQSKRTYAFGPFRLDSGGPVLLRDGRPVPLAPKFAETLLVLVENAGQLVSKSELIERVWPDSFVEESNLPKSVYELRKALGQENGGPVYIRTLHKRGYRFEAPVEVVWEGDSSESVALTDLGLPSPAASSPADFNVAEAGPGQGPELSLGIGYSRSPFRASAWRRWGLDKMAPWLAVVAVGVGIGAYLYSRLRPASKLSERDTVVLADFLNQTGDRVFDGTLRQGLSAQLEQSPFLNLLSDDRITQTLALMTQPRDARLSPALAREVCLRTASAAVIEGSIAMLGSQYVIGLKAVNCQDGNGLATEQVTADSKEQVLRALGDAATKLREKLGESLTSIEKYDVPQEDVTTASLEALRNYSLGQRAWNVNGELAGALFLYEKAISLDPMFAMAYMRLGECFINLGETARAADNLREAYQLRNRVSERERFFIELEYPLWVTRDLEAARQDAELWAQAYPRDPHPYGALGVIYALFGQADGALNQEQESLRLSGMVTAVDYATLVIRDLALYRLDEARATAQKALTHSADSPLLHIQLYLLDFFEHDPAGMERESASLAGKSEYEDVMLCYESDTASYFGQFSRARELTYRAMEYAGRVGEEEEAAGYEAEAAVREVLVGNTALAQQQAHRATALSRGRDAEAISAIALGLAADSPEAARLGNDLDRRFPKDTILQSEYLPMIRASRFLGGNNASGQAGRATEALVAATRYELADTSATLDFALYPAYLRGQAYLAARNGTAAAPEFQKIIDHPGIVLNTPIGALAHLGLARAYTLEAGVPLAVHDRRTGRFTRKPLPRPEMLARALAAYRAFFACWKDADPDIPILNQARAEYSSLN